MQKQSNIKLRYNIITVAIYIIGIVLLMQLFNLQIIHGAEYRENSNTRLTRETVLKAARGNISDSTGTALVETTTSISLEMYKSKIDNNKLNETILKTIKVLEQNGDKYVDSFPIAINPFEFTQKDEEKEKKWKKSNKIDQNLTAEEVFYKFKEKYKIEENDIEDIRKIIVIRYQIEQEGYSSTKPIQIADSISIQSRDIISEQNDSFPGIYTVVQPVRSYPKGSLASHIIGYTSKIDKNEYEQEKDNGYTKNDYYGKAGIEKVAEKYLKGQDGTKQLDMAVDGTITDEYISKEAIQGSNVILTIDANLQAVTEKALKDNIQKIANGGFSDRSNANAGAMVVMNVKTGEILAMASYPDYEPNKFTFGIDNETWNIYKDETTKPMSNRAIQEVYPPGSIYKMVTATAGLETGYITPKTKINDTGVYPKAGNPVCWIWTSNHRGHGWLNVSQAIQHSCNYFFYDIGYNIGIDMLERYTRYYGLGSKTGVELPSEASGTLNHKEEGKVWYPGDTLSASIGQKDNQFTPLQMAKYASMLANGGKVVNPTIIKAIQKSDGTEIPKEEYEAYFNEKLGIQEKQEDLVLNPDNLKTILEGMHNVTSESGGTAYSTFRNFNIEVGGKTGSAQTGRIDERGNKITHGWFLGFAPFDDPEIAVVVMVENAGHGGYTAEAARDVMEQYFGMNSNQVVEDVTAKPYTEIQN
ncbi:MAG: penicillin-binding protein 2 [Clostridia bacterium]|nr:penicillin-binding protein 2 [Clostridia bacterium]